MGVYSTDCDLERNEEERRSAMGVTVFPFGFLIFFTTFCSLLHHGSDTDPCLFWKLRYCVCVCGLIQELSFVWTCVLWFGSPLMSSNGEKYKYSRGGGRKHPCVED